MTSPLQTVCAAPADATSPKISASQRPSSRRERRCMAANYFEAYSDGSDCRPSTQSTVTLSSFDLNIEIVAFGLTTGSTRAVRISDKYCDCSVAGFSRITKNVQTLKIASAVAPTQTNRRIGHQTRPPPALS